MKFRILCEKGDAPFDYDLDVAEIKFNELVGSGFLPMVVKDNRHIPLQSFDRDAKEVVFVPKIVGG